MKKFTLTLSLCVGFLLSAGCASMPKSGIEKISSSANSSEEIATTEQNLAALKAEQVDVFSPQNYEKAVKYLNKAKEQRANDAKNEKILESVAISRAWAKEAREKSEIAKDVMSNVETQRANAVNAGASNYYKKDLMQLDERSKSMTEEIEEGSLKEANKNADQLAADYQKLYSRTLEKTLLGEAENNLTTAEKEGAQKLSPQTFAYAKSKVDAARQSIYKNPSDATIHQTLAMDATKETARLLRVNRESKTYHKMSPEEIALQAESQKQNIQHLRNVSSAQEEQIHQEKAQVADLEQQQAMIDKADKIRKSFQPQEATVLTEGDKVILRLKGLNFASNQSTIPAKNFSLLKKVQDSLKEFPDSKVVVQGHTDAVGSAELNKVLSEKRAQAVGDYLTAQRSIDKDHLEIVGSGFDHPISENKTAAGRAQNRRIDIIIEPTNE